MADRDIIESIRKIVGGKAHAIEATVDSVDEANRTCNVTSDSTAIENVRLMASVDDGVLFIPTIGSTIFIGYTQFNVPFVVQFSSIDKVLFITGSTALQLVDGKLTLNDGSYGGLVKITELTQKINALENLLNDLISKFNSHTHILSLSSGTGTAAPTAAPETGTITPTQQSDIENTLITHGK